MISQPYDQQGLDFRRAYAQTNLAGEDLDEEYDEYEFHPSISPYALFPITDRHDALPPLRLSDGGLLQVCSTVPVLQRSSDASCMLQLPSPCSTDYGDDGLEPYEDDSSLLSPVC